MKQFIHAKIVQFSKHIASRFFVNVVVVVAVLMMDMNRQPFHLINILLFEYAKFQRIERMRIRAADGWMR